MCIRSERHIQKSVRSRSRKCLTEPESLDPAHMRAPRVTATGTLRCLPQHKVHGVHSAQSSAVAPGVTIPHSEWKESMTSCLSVSGPGVCSTGCLLVAHVSFSKSPGLGVHVPQSRFARKRCFESILTYT